MPTPHLTAVTALALVLAVRLHAQSDSCRDRDEWTVWDDDRIHYCEIRVEHLPRLTGPLAIDGHPNGSIRVRGADGDSVVLLARIESTASSDADAKALAAQVRVVTTSGAIHAEGPETSGRSHWVVSYRVTVPRHTDLTLDAKNGGISVSDVESHMRLTTVNGPISLSGAGGDVQARGRNGPLDITLTGARWSGTGLDAETENGPVTLTVPKNYAAHLEVGTERGPMDIDLPLTVQGHVNLRQISTDIGGGGPPIRAVTTNGPISVQRD
jgi:hypothetical protein